MESERIDVLVKRLSDLVSIPTINPPGEHYEEAAGLLADWLREVGMRTELIMIPEKWLDKHYPYSPAHHGYPRVIVYAYVGNKERALHFNGHYDVVPPGSGWRVTDPFRPVVRDGRMYGRGT
ncbi:MAG: M20/M25/M40 family metallo-hydrolase, partial [Candidatus Korarchaeota archaeon]|nr:M20/M25/M40 family metallo-hydrolase [Candidatus Korarchaeota archaeon]